MQPLVDTHAHLDEMVLPRRMEDLEGAIERARARGVVAIVAVGSDYESNRRTLEIAERHRGYVHPALGLHPWNLGQAASHLERNLRFIEDHIREIVAIGEIGLDYRRDIVSGAGKDLQKNVLHNCLELAKRHHKPALVHSRYAWRDCLDVVRGVGVGRVVFHWFTGPLNVLRDILGQGYMVSATLAAEYHEEHRRAIKEAPLESLMLETDAPVVYRGHRSEPADVSRSLRAVAELKSLDPDQVARRTTENAFLFYGLRVGEEV
ncbi:MAG: TatD family hydrolase [Dehalococcoidia bacterium]